MKANVPRDRSSVDHSAAWLAIQRQVERGIISADDARRLEAELYESMWHLGLEPDDVTGPLVDVSVTVYVEKEVAPRPLSRSPIRRQ